MVKISCFWDLNQTKFKLALQYQRKRWSLHEVSSFIILCNEQSLNATYFTNVSPHFHWQKSFATVSVTWFLRLRVSLTWLTLTRRLIGSSIGNYHAYPFCIIMPGTWSLNYLVAKVDKSNYELHWLFGCKTFLSVKVGVHLQKLPKNVGRFGQINCCHGL